MTSNNAEKLKEIFKDQDLAKKVFKDETPENALELLKEKGVDISIEELGQIREQIRDFIEKVKNGEISEEQLKRMQEGELELEDMKQVSGGLFVEMGLIYAFAVTFGGAAVGTGISCAIAFWD